MERWLAFAILSMIFAGCTSVVAKKGLDGISGDIGLAVRTLFVVLFVAGFAMQTIPGSEFWKLTWRNLLFLGLSGLTTTLSWVFYYKALKLGDVSTIALIDKGSFLVAVLLSWLLLHEKITWRVGLGSILILAGLIVASKK
jgi:transporter family protein